ncbi:hypothetical protein ACPXCE_08510 [Streptomyces sp. DT24]|uniref:hypothetical protein n=1 Tax=Streptomyces sp. DT24 TaxID=3416520 RepID=UPI003CF82AD9
MLRSPSSRTAGRALLVSALLTAVSALPATAAAPQAPTAPAAHSVALAPAVQQVGHFYGAYIDALGGHDRALATALRTFYLTPRLRAELRDWESRHHADGVLRSQNVPTGYQVTQGSSGAGHTWSRVRLAWGTGEHRTYTQLTVQSDLRTGKISYIR